MHLVHLENQDPVQVMERKKRRERTPKGVRKKKRVQGRGRKVLRKRCRRKEKNVALRGKTSPCTHKRFEKGFAF